MPVLQRRQQALAPRQAASNRDSTDSLEREHLWVVEEDYEQAQEEMDVSTAKLRRQAPGQKSRNTLRINTRRDAELHERYLSSEEEPSPSPSENIENHDQKVTQKSSEINANDTLDLSKITESKAEIAVAVPIMAIGRPKLIDITNLAPMHKRKRVSQPLTPVSVNKKVASKVSSTDTENMPSLVRDSADVLIPKRKPIAPKRQDSLPSMQAPDSWLPEDVPEPLDVDEHYFPIGVRPTPSYRDYDPYSLEPPRLSRTNSPTSSKEIIRARVNSNPPLAINAARFKGLTRSLSLAKRQDAQRQQRQIVKKPKMVARGANEREDMLVIPPFPFEEGISVG